MPRSEITPIPNIGLANTFSEWVNSHNRLINDVINPLRGRRDSDPDVDTIAAVDAQIGNGYFGNVHASGVSVFGQELKSVANSAVSIVSANNDAMHPVVRIHNPGSRENSDSAWGAGLAFSVSANNRDPLGIPYERQVDKAQISFVREPSGIGKLSILVDDSSDDDRVTEGDEVWSYSPGNDRHEFRVNGTIVANLESNRVQVNRLEIQKGTPAITFPDGTTQSSAATQVDLASNAEHTQSSPPANKAATPAGVRAVRDALLASNTEHTQSSPPANKAATPAGVRAVRDALLDSPPGALDTLNELAAALGDDANFSATVTSLINARAPLNSPAFTGTPTAPTPTAGDDTTRIATTAWVTDFFPKKPPAPTGAVSDPFGILWTYAAATGQGPSIIDHEFQTRRQGDPWPMTARVGLSQRPTRVAPIVTGTTNEARARERSARGASDWSDVGSFVGAIGDSRFYIGRNSGALALNLSGEHQSAEDIASISNVQAMDVDSTRLYSASGTDDRIRSYDFNGNEQTSERVSINVGTVTALAVTSTRFYVVEQNTATGTFMRVYDRSGTRMSGEDITVGQNVSVVSIAVTDSRVYMGLNRGSGNLIEVWNRSTRARLQDEFITLTGTPSINGMTSTQERIYGVGIVNSSLTIVSIGFDGTEYTSENITLSIPLSGNALSLGLRIV